MPAEVAQLADAANRLRVTAIESTAAASNFGYPISGISASEIVATLFFDELKYDVKNPKDVNADRFVMSMGHAAPILYAAWQEAGLLTKDQIMKLGQIDSELDTEPSPRLSFIDFATGSLGQGLSMATGLAYVGKYLDKSSYRTYCLLGDGEIAEGAVWEAANFASYNHLDNLVAIVDINRLGQSRATSLGHDLDAYALRFEAFGWHSIKIDGHNIQHLLKSYEEARETHGKPTVILARTFKGSGLEMEKGLPSDFCRAVSKESAEPIRAKLTNKDPQNWAFHAPIFDTPKIDLKIGNNRIPTPNYNIGDKIATRQAYGNALLKLAQQNKRVISLDGDVGNSTCSEILAKKLPDQSIQCYISEQQMVGAAVGLQCRRRTIPFVNTFAVFFTRARDQIRMAGVSMANVKFVGSHCGISIGDDGPSQMGLEDIAMFRGIPGATVLYPSDAVSTERATELAANIEGIVFIRTGRPTVPVIYENNERFEIGRCKILKQSGKDRVMIIGAGITLNEAMKAEEQLRKENINVTIIDIFCVQPIDRETLIRQARKVGGRVLVVEDHYQAGGIGEAVAAALCDQPGILIKRLCVQEVPRSGAPDALLDRYGISARHIVEAAKSF